MNAGRKSALRQMICSYGNQVICMAQNLLVDEIAVPRKRKKESENHYGMMSQHLNHKQTI